MNKTVKIIAKFMGLDAVTIGYYGMDNETEWQVKNREWLDRPEIVEQYNNSVGDYYVNIKRNIIIPQEEINYSKDWNDLMGVINQIEKIEGVTTTLKNKRFVIKYWKKTFSCHTVVKINSTYRVVVEFLDWYTNNKSHE
jgi:hypothetical protein